MRTKLKDTERIEIYKILNKYDNDKKTIKIDDKFNKERD